MADTVRRGRYPNRQGENHHLAYLSSIQVSHIRFFLQDGWTCAMLAERYGVSPSTIAHIKCGESWKHVQPYQPIDGEPLPNPPPIKLTAPALRRF
jgi:hypothetical protein